MSNAPHPPSAFQNRAVVHWCTSHGCWYQSRMLVEFAHTSQWTFTSPTNNHNSNAMMMGVQQQHLKMKMEGGYEASPCLSCDGLLRRPHSPSNGSSNRCEVVVCTAVFLPTHSHQEVVSADILSSARPTTCVNLPCTHTPSLLSQNTQNTQHPQERWFTPLSDAHEHHLVCVG